MWFRPASDPDSSATGKIGSPLGLLCEAVVAGLLLVTVFVFAILHRGDTGKNSPLLRLTEFQAIALSEFPVDALDPKVISTVRSQHRSTNGDLMRQTDSPVLVRFEFQSPAESNRLIVELDRIRAAKARMWLGNVHIEGKSILDGGLAEYVVERNGRGLASKIELKEHSRVELFLLFKADMPARTSLTIWSHEQYPSVVSDFDGTGGVLYGSLLVLGLFAALIAVINKDRTFWIFSGVALTSLRVAAVNGGWDAYWLGFELTSRYIYLGLQLSLIAHAVLVIELFREIFRPSLSPLETRSFSILQYALLSASVIAVLAPLPIFLAVCWTLSGIGMVILLLSTAAICFRKPSATAFLYAASWVATFGGIFAEISMASGLLARSSFPLNSRTGAILSVMLLAATLAERLRTERFARQAAQLQSVAAMSRFRDTYNSVPIGLFSLDHQGLFASVNPSFTRMFGDDLSSDALKQLRWTDLFPNEYLVDLKSLLAKNQ